MANVRKPFLPVLLALLVAFQQRPFAEGDIYSASVQLEDLAGVEAYLKGNLENYINMETNRVEKIKYFYESLKKISLNRNEDGGVKYLNNPVNAYLLIKRFAQGWQELKHLLSEDLSKGKP